MKWQIPIVLILLGAMLSYAVYTQTRPDPERLRFQAAGHLAYGYGTSKDWSIEEVKAFIRQNPNVDTLVLKAMPGTHHSVVNLRIARHIRRKGLATHLEADSWIASGAVDLFLSGTKRTMECGAKIGVHSWSNNYGQTGQDEGRDNFESLHKNFLRDMGITPAFYDFTRAAAPPEDIYWLTGADIKRFDFANAISRLQRTLQIRPARMRRY